MNLVKVQALYKYYYDKHKVDVEFSMGDWVLLSTKHSNVIGDRKLVPCFVGPFSIVK